MRTLFASLGALLASAALAPAAGAVPLVLSDGSNLVNADTNDLPHPGAPIPITGLQAGEKLVGIDQRPITGQLYGIGDSSRMYVLNPASGAATEVGTGGSFTVTAGNSYGTDFNPIVDRLRAVSDGDQNMRLNPDTGALTQLDTPLNPGNPNVVAAAYDNNFATPTTTTLFDIDSVTGELRRQGGPNGTPSPNSGTLTSVGPLGVAPSNEDVGFDIGADGVALATITVGGMSGLYGINTVTGAATLLGTIGTGTTSYSGLAIMSARIRFASGSASAIEGTTATLEVSRSAPAGGPVSVQYATAPGTAAEGEDFTPSTGTVAWGAGEAGTKTIAIPVVGNPAAEGDETFTVALSNVTGTDAALGAPAAATVTIPANPEGPTLQFASGGVSTSEGGSAKLEVTRVGSSELPVTVDYATVPGSATETDYTPTNGTLTWAAGDAAPKTIDVPIIDDNSEEDEESFGVVLDKPSGATIGAPSETEVTIDPSDTRPPQLTLSGKKKQKLRNVRRKGVAIVARSDRECDLRLRVRRAGRKRSLGLHESTLDGKRTVHVKLKTKARKKLRRGQKLTVSGRCAGASGTSRKASRTIRLTR